MNFTSNSILSTINELFGSMFASIDDSIYSALDQIAFIDTDILNSTYLEKILGTSSNSGILIIANALLIGFILYFAVRHLLSSFAIIDVQNPYKFILKLIFVGIFMNASFFLCTQVINLNSILSTAIRICLCYKVYSFKSIYTYISFCNFDALNALYFSPI